MVFPSVPLVAALWEYHKGGPPDSFANSQGDQSPDATAARNRINDLARNTGVDYQPSKVGEDAYKNPANLDNLYDRIQKMDVGAVTTLHQTWEAFRGKLEQGHNTFGPAILKALQEKWKGAAGQQAATGISDFVAKENDLVISAQLVSEKMKLARSAIEITKPGAQPAPHSTWTSDIAGWVPGPTWKVNDHRKSEANTANEHLINNVFYPAVRESDTQVPLAPQPYNPINTPTGATGPGSIGPGATGPGSTGGTGPGGTSGPGTNNEGASGPGTTAPGASGPGADTTSSDYNPSSSSSANPSSATSSGVDPKSATTPSSLNTAGYGPGGSSGGGLGGLGGGPGGGPGGGVAGPGSSMPGSGPAKGPAANAAAAQVGKNAAAGMGAMGSMAGKGKEKEEEKTHKSKISEALVSEENGDEVTGLGRFAKKTVPQVLGQDGLE